MRVRRAVRLQRWSERLGGVSGWVMWLNEVRDRRMSACVCGWICDASDAREWDAGGGDGSGVQVDAV